MMSRIQTLEQVRAFLEGTAGVAFSVPSPPERRRCIATTLEQFGYHRCGKADKGLLVRYLCHITGYSRQQLTRLIAQHRRCGRIQDRRGKPARPFVQRFRPEDARALAELDALHGQLAGPATKKLCERAYQHFGDDRYARLSTISVSHLYNLRGSKTYERTRGTVHKTRSVTVPIGERRAPRPEGRPGFLRVDSVHSGDWDGAKGLYLINAVDEITQFEFVLSTVRISEHFLLPVLTELIGAFPFPVLGFHADNGSEYINHRVAKLLNKLLVTEFTKSRPRHSNDNALVESKNGSVIRKHLGYAHLPASAQRAVNAFLREHLWPYLNYHRPCAFAHTRVDGKGRQRKHYRYQDLMTPYEKFKSLHNAAAYLKPDLTFTLLDAKANALSDNESARRLNHARQRLFQSINPGRSNVA